jgi:hypothetical protein
LSHDRKDEKKEVANSNNNNNIHISVSLHPQDGKFTEDKKYNITNTSDPGPG